MRYALSLIVAIGLVIASEARAQDYHIKLVRPDKQGDTYPVSAIITSKETQVVSLPGGDPKTESQSVNVEFEGSVTVLEVKDSKTTKLACTVSKCLMDSKPAIEPGKVITVENVDGKTVMTVDGKPLDPTLTDSLNVALSTDNPTQPISNDDMFGTADPKKVGDSWPIDSQAVAGSISHDSPLVTKENVKGTAKLVEIKKVNDKDALVIAVKATANVPPGKFPDGPSFEKAVISIQYSCVVPAAPDGKVISESNSTHIETHLTKTADNQPMSGDVTVDRSATISYVGK